MPGPLLIDVSCLCDAHTDIALEAMHKAIGEEPPDGDIWSPHPNPFVRRLVELFTERGLTRVAGLEGELGRWLRGDEHLPALARPARPVGAMVRWAPAEMGIARLYLQSLPPAEFSLDDWMMLVDYLVQRYLPDADLRMESDWLVTRANIMGRVQAAMGDITDAGADAILVAAAIDDAVATRGITPQQRAVVEYGRARCGENVTALAEGARRRLRRLVVDQQEAEFLGNRAVTAESLQTKLLDTFGTLNRDWRRIAITEATENVNQAFVAAAGSGAKLRRVEKYRGACPHCRNIDGRVVTVVDPSTVPQDGEATVWVGKTNIGRSSSPRRREGGALVDRESHELWWVAAGAQHPNCRGAWVRVAEGATPDPEFERWLAEMDRTRGKP